MAEKTNSLLEAIEGPYRVYWAELGRFIHQFAETEHSLLRFLNHLLKLPPEVAGALFVGLRASVAKDRINHLLGAMGQPDAVERLKPALDQLGVINNVRDNLVHWGATHTGSDDLLVTNASFSPRPTALKAYRVSPASLRAMTDDLRRVRTYIAVEIRHRPHEDAELAEWLRRPWRYKPPQQSVRAKIPIPRNAKALRTPPKS